MSTKALRISQATANAGQTSWLEEAMLGGCGSTPGPEVSLVIRSEFHQVHRCARGSLTNPVGSSDSKLIGTRIITL